MNRTSHTPGPWAARRAGSQSGAVIEVAQRISPETKHPKTICRMVAGTLDDARLIAAAPATAAERDRLREALQETSSRLQSVIADYVALRERVTELEAKNKTLADATQGSALSDAKVISAYAAMEAELDHAREIIGEQQATTARLREALEKIRGIYGTIPAIHDIADKALSATPAPPTPSIPSAADALQAAERWAAAVDNGCEIEGARSAVLEGADGAVDAIRAIMATPAPPSPVDARVAELEAEIERRREAHQFQINWLAVMREALHAMDALVQRCQMLCRMYLEPGDRRVETEAELARALIETLDGPVQRDAQGRTSAALAAVPQREGQG